MFDAVVVCPDDETSSAAAFVKWVRVDPQGGCGSACVVVGRLAELVQLECTTVADVDTAVSFLIGQLGS
jgi:hypothetical protein